MPQSSSYHSNRWYRRHPEASRTSPPTEPPKQSRKPVHQRLLEFFEQPLFLLAASVIGGIVGFVLYPPVFALCGVCVVLAFHRAKVVSEESWPVQGLSYLALCCFVVWGLYALHWKLDKRLADSNMSFSQLVASAVTKSLPKPSPSNSEKGVPPASTQPPTTEVSPPKVETPAYPPPKGPGIAMTGRVYPPSMQMCLDVSGEKAQIDCLCPSI
jgi:hypothetical protein